MASPTTGNGLPDVVVTGIAMTTSVATSAEGTWSALLEGKSGIRRLEDPFVEQFELPVKIGGHLLEDFDSELTKVENRRMSYPQKMSTILGRRVWENAGNPEVDTERLLVSIGTGLGGAEALVFAAAHGADLLDVGGESTRPSATPVADRWRVRPSWAVRRSRGPGRARRATPVRCAVAGNR